jgi:hypothetical protein
MLTGFEVEGVRPAPGFRIQEGGKDVAEITSVASVPTESGERILALGYGRREAMVPGKEFVTDDAKIRVAGLPCAGIFPCEGLSATDSADKSVRATQVEEFNG